MEDAALKAGKSLNRDFGELERLQVSKKGTGDFVTSADLRAEKLIMETLQKGKPDYSFLVEESGELVGKDTTHRWIIDPLDGTNNFMHGVPHFCISIGLEKRTDKGSEIIAALVFAPVLNEIYIAEKGEGAFLNGKRLLCSARVHLNESLVAGYIFRGGDERTNKDVRALASTGCNVRVLGAAALELAYVAAGKLDGFWHHNLKSWDMAAGSLLVREAKGMVSAVDGSELILDKGNILATNAGIYDKLKDKLGAAYTS